MNDIASDSGDDSEGRFGSPRDERWTDWARTAVGVMAARRRGDEAAARDLIAQFPDPAAQAVGFCVVAELAVTLLAQACGQDVEEIMPGIGLALAAGPTSTPRG